jgi:CO/xanthine dehydrogenase Mo-binding subunit
LCALPQIVVIAPGGLLLYPAWVEVLLIDRPRLPFPSVGQAAQGRAVAALANAINHATGVTVRDLPLRGRKSRDSLKT